MDLHLSSQPARSVVSAFLVFLATVALVRGEKVVEFKLEGDHDVTQIGQYLSARGLISELVSYFEGLVAGEKELLVVHHQAEFHIDWVVWMMRLDTRIIVGVYDPIVSSKPVKGFSVAKIPGEKPLSGLFPSRHDLREKLSKLMEKDAANRDARHDDTIIVISRVNNEVIFQGAFHSEHEESRDALFELFPSSSILHEALKTEEELNRAGE